MRANRNRFTKSSRFWNYQSSDYKTIMLSICFSIKTLFECIVWVNGGVETAKGELWPGSRLEEETMGEAAKRIKKMLKCARKLRKHSEKSEEGFTPI